LSSFIFSFKIKTLKINFRPTYRLIFSMFFALLLVNVFVAKELHYIVEFSHGHEHHLVDPHSECSNTTHFHEYNYDAECHICDFNFSPKDQTDLQTLHLNITAFSNIFVSHQIDLLLNSDKTPTSLRGPPNHFS